MKLIVLLAAAVTGLQFLSAVIHSQEVDSLPPLRSLWHPNLYIAKDWEGNHYEVRHSAKTYAASLSFLQTRQNSSPLMDCRCRFEARGSAPGPGSFLQKSDVEVAPITQVERPGRNKTLTYEMALSPREDVPQLHLSDLPSTQQPAMTLTMPPVPTQPMPFQPVPMDGNQPQPLAPAPPSQMFQQLNQPSLMYPQPMMPMQTAYYPPPQAYFYQQPQGYFQPYYPQPTPQVGFVQSQLYQQPDQYGQYQTGGYMPRY